VCELGRLSFLHDDAAKAFFRIVALILVPLAVYLSGLALLATLVTAIVWIGLILVIVFAYVRFHEKHNEHEEYDDHTSQKEYNEGLRTYISLVHKRPKEEEPAEEKSK
jgi:fatty acid desaturase